MELTFLGSRAGYRNSTAVNWPEVLLSWYNRGVKLNRPGSEGHSTVLTSGLTETVQYAPAPHLAAYSHTPSCLSYRGVPRMLLALPPHHIPK